MKEQEAKGLLGSLGIKTPLDKIPLLGDILFWGYKIEWNCEQIFTGRRYILPEMHFKQPGFTYSACSPFIRNKERIEKLT